MYGVSSLPQRVSPRCGSLASNPPVVSAQRPPTIAAAANLNFALTEVAEQFARAAGNRVELVFGASGTLTRQIQDGAPFEMFLAADEEFPEPARRRPA